MNLLETLILGAYVYTTGGFLYLMRKIERFQLNHLRHAERAINEVRERLGMPPVKLEEK